MAKKGQNELKHFHILLSLEEFQNINNQSISRKERYKHLLTVFPEFYETLLGKRKLKVALILSSKDAGSNKNPCPLAAILRSAGV